MGLSRLLNRIIATLFGTRTRMALSTMGVAGLLAVIPMSVVFAAQDETEPTTPAAGQDIEQEEVTELPVTREPRGERFAPGKMIVKLKKAYQAQLWKNSTAAMEAGLTSSWHPISCLVYTASIWRLVWQCGRQ